MGFGNFPGVWISDCLADICYLGYFAIYFVLPQWVEILALFDGVISWCFCLFGVMELHIDSWTLACFTILRWRRIEAQNGFDLDIGL